MPLALSFVLNATARAGLMTIKGGVARGLSADSITTIMQHTTGGIARWRVLEIMRAYKGLSATTPRLQNLRLDAFPDIKRLPTAITKLRRNLSFVVQVTGTFTPTGHKIKQFVTIALDEMISRRDIQDIAMNAILSDFEAYPLEDIETMIMTGTKAGDSGLL